ncbi:MAG: thioredoxin family protein, partial [marine benthic group bacterium]|nr:thioredoxin family protein [Gemmatimonadota bacterium]
MRFPALFLLLCLVGPGRSLAQESSFDDPSPHSEAVLISGTESIRPGEPFEVGLHLTLEPDWHSYWRNPGDSGEATSITWRLPEGFVAGEIQWPVPEAISFPPLVSYGYFDEVLLLVEITPPASLTTGDTVRLAGRADWLVCIEDCFPAEAELELSLPVLDALPRPDPRTAGLFEVARSRLPVPGSGWVSFARANEQFLGLRIDPPDEFSPLFEAGSENVRFFASDGNVIDHAAEQRPDWDGETLVIRLARSGFARGTPDTLRGVLATEDASAGQAGPAIEIAAPVIVAGSADDPAPAGTGGAGGAVVFGDGGPGLGLSLLFALLGGLLLNLMPCVFPVLSLKVLGFAEHAGKASGSPARQGAAFAAGVLVSFWVLGAVLLVLRAAGEGVGWGFQLQSPLFVGLMAVLFFLLGLALLGVFEVGLSLTRLGGLDPAAVGSGSTGVGRSFFSGVLATVVATPCTAPFMGAALGWAILQPPVETMLVFTALGAGMALPYVILSLSPALIDRLPAPGRWMETLKQLLAFPLLGTVVWLAWVFGLQTGVDGLAGLLIALLLIGLLLWTIKWSRGIERKGGARVTAGVVSVTIAVLAALTLVRASRLAPAFGAAAEYVSGADLAPEGDSVRWAEWSPRVESEIRSAGRPLLVDFTAAWCLSCKVNERLVLNTAEV